MAVLNPSFETPGALGVPGEAESWTEGYSSCAEDIAAFAHHDGYTRPYDDFETSWDDNHLYQTAFSVTDLLQCMFEGLVKRWENFESGWRMPNTAVGDTQNQASIFTFAADWFTKALFDSFGSGAEDAEDFEEDWHDNHLYQTAFDPSDLTNAHFSSTVLDWENFELEWQNNENYDTYFLYAVPDMRLIPALFDGGGTPYENFEGVWPTVLI